MVRLTICSSCEPLWQVRKQWWPVLLTCVTGLPIDACKLLCSLISNLLTIRLRTLLPDLKHAQIALRDILVVLVTLPTW